MMLEIDLQLFGGRGAGSGRRWRRSRGKQRPLIAQDEPPTLKEALGKKGRAKSINNAYKNANPGYDPRKIFGDEYSINCQRCVVAYEARRRGYDVVAQPNFDKMGKSAFNQQKTKGTGRSGDNSFVSNNYWQGAFKHAKPRAITLTDAQLAKYTNRQYKKRAQVLQSNAIKQIKQWGPGSRAIIGLQWKKGGGHVFSAEYNKRTKQVEFYDAQTGKRATFSDYFQKAHADWAAKIVRTDNLRFSERAKKMVIQRKDYEANERSIAKLSKKRSEK